MQLAVAATTVARRMTARTVSLCGTELFQSAAMRGVVRESHKLEKRHKCDKKRKQGESKHGMRNLSSVLETLIACTPKIPQYLVVDNHVPRRAIQTHCTNGELYGTCKVLGRKGRALRQGIVVHVERLLAPFSLLMQLSLRQLSIFWAQEMSPPTAALRSCGFESVVWTNSLNHARLSWRVLTILILYGIATRASIRSGKEPTIKYRIQPVGELGAGTGARAETRLGGGSGKGRSLGGGGHRER
eukprot:2576524-Pleurochrysis_carterae.AAC.1